VPLFLFTSYFFVVTQPIQCTRFFWNAKDTNLFVVVFGLYQLYMVASNQLIVVCFRKHVTN